MKYVHDIKKTQIRQTQFNQHAKLSFGRRRKQRVTRIAGQSCVEPYGCPSNDTKSRKQEATDAFGIQFHSDIDKNTGGVNDTSYFIFSLFFIGHLYMYTFVRRTTWGWEGDWGVGGEVGGARCGLADGTGRRETPPQAHRTAPPPPAATAASVPHTCFAGSQLCRVPLWAESQKCRRHCTHRRHGKKQTIS
jgi:hypothetical protein